MFLTQKPFFDLLMKVPNLKSRLELRRILKSQNPVGDMELNTFKNNVGELSTFLSKRVFFGQILEISLAKSSKSGTRDSSRAVPSADVSQVRRELRRIFSLFAALFSGGATLLQSVLFVALPPRSIDFSV
jgi:hypothetical protein